MLAPFHAHGHIQLKSLIRERSTSDHYIDPFGEVDDQWLIEGGTTTKEYLGGFTSQPHVETTVLSKPGALARWYM